MAPVGIVEVLTDVVMAPLVALGASLADLMVALFGNSARIIIAGMVASLGSLRKTGPMTFVLGVTASLASVYLIRVYLEEQKTSEPIPSLTLPWVSYEEEEEQEDVLPDGGDEEAEEDEEVGD